MKYNFRYFFYFLLASGVFGLLLFKGYSDTNKFIFFCALALIGILEAGKKFGFNKELPRAKISEKIIKAIHLLFCFLFILLLNKNIGDDIIEIIITSKALLVLIYFWLLFVLFKNFRNETKYNHKDSD